MRSNIRMLRKARHITQTELGRAIGLSQQAVSRIERDRNMIQIDVLISLADYFEVPTDCILGRSAEPGRRTALPEELLLAVQEMAGSADQESGSFMDEAELMEKKMSFERRMAVWQLLVCLKHFL